MKRKSDPPNHYDAKKCADDKQRARQRDEQDLASGSVSKEELGSRNGKFAFPRVRVEIEKAKALS